VVFYRSGVKRNTSSSEFDIASVTKLPRVDIIMTYQGADGDLIESAVDSGAKGIVLATAGAGATSGTQQDGINYALKKGAIVVTTTRTGSGRIAPPQGRGRCGQPSDNPNAPTADELRRRIAGEDLAPVKARVLLMLALTRTSEPKEIQRMFAEY
jgi:L-asparaginase